MYAPGGRPFWQFLAEWLRRNEWSQTQLADAVGVHQTVVSKWLHADIRRRARPGRQALLRLSDVLSVPTEDLAAMVLEDQRAVEDARHEARMAREPENIHVNSELLARLTRLADRLGRYPRPFWLPVIEANERMADALETLPEPEPPVIGPAHPRINAPKPAKTKDSRDHEGGLSVRLPALHALFATR